MGWMADETGLEKRRANYVPLTPLSHLNRARDIFGDLDAVVYGDTRHSYQIDGTETFDVVGEPAPRAELTVVMHRTNGESVEFPVTCRLDTAEEVYVYSAGGVLQRFAQDFLSQAA